MANTRSLQSLSGFEGPFRPAFVTFGSVFFLVVGLVRRRVRRVGLPAALVIVASMRVWLAFAPNVTLLFSLVGSGFFAALYISDAEGLICCRLYWPEKL